MNKSHSNVAPTSPLLQEGRCYVRSRWYNEAIHAAAHQPKVIQARARMRSGGFRERLQYWYTLSVHLNRPAYFEYKVAGVLDRLPAGRPEDIVAISATPRPLLYFQSPEIVASLALLLGWRVTPESDRRKE